MATIIKIKRSSSTSAPSALAQGELAYSYGTGTVGNNGDRLFIGTGTETDGEAANIDVIGGKYFTQLTDHTPGTLSATSAILVDSNKAIDELFIGNNATTGGTLKLNEGTNNGAHFVALKAPNSVTADTTFTLPDGDGSNGQFLKTDGSGNLSFETVVSTLSLAADSGTADGVSTGETITFTGGTGIDTTVSDNTITFAIDNTVATLDDTQTLTNKTLTSPNVSGLNITDSSIVFEGSTVDSFETTLTVTDPTADRTITLPNASDTLVGKATTDILTNKTINSDSNTITLDLSEGTLTGTHAEFNSALSDGTFVEIDASQTLTGKTINGPDNTLTNIANSSLSNSSVTFGSTEVALGASSTAIAGVTQLDVDNVRINGNTISSTDSNGDIVLDPNGSGTVDVNSSRIINVTDPSGDQDAATKAYVDSVANGLDVKDSCRLATASALAASTYNNGAGTLTADANGALSVDGVSVTVNDRILVKDQSSSVQNGIYKVTATGGPSAAFVLTRSPDADTASELTGGTFFFVEEGTANADNGYVATHNGTPTFGSTNITFAQFSGAGQISAGDALTKTGNQLDVAVDDSSIEISSDALQVKASGITNAMLAGSIANGKLANSTVSFGGISLALGATDATPAFDLSDATNYPASSLSGTVANNQLANSVITFSDDSSTTVDVDLGSTLAIAGGEGIDATISGSTLSIIGELATTSNKGVASFSSDNFTVSSGAVTVTTIDGGTF